MESVRVYLRAPLFATRVDPHLPAKAVILEGTVEDRATGGLQLQVTGWRDHEGKSLDGATLRLFVPLSKIDHIVLLDGGAPT